MFGLLVTENLFIKPRINPTAPKTEGERPADRAKMPLGERHAGDKSESRYCGVETDFDDDMPNLLSFNIHGGFDFVVATLVS